MELLAAAGFIAGLCGLLLALRIRAKSKEIEWRLEGAERNIKWLIKKLDHILAREEKIKQEKQSAQDASQYTKEDDRAEAGQDAFYKLSYQKPQEPAAVERGVNEKKADGPIASKSIAVSQPTNKSAIQKSVESSSAQRKAGQYSVNAETPKSQETKTLEERIGINGALIAGVLTVIVGMGFFFKYAYDHYSFGPTGKIAGGCTAGLIALLAGEITRRRRYGSVAKSVTALGFAIFDANDFAALRLFDIIGPATAFGISVVITVCALGYALFLNESLIAVLALAGGYITPLIVSSGENLPNQLFGYVLILTLGALGCSYYRKWRLVNLAAFIGTVLICLCWYVKFIWPVSAQEPAMLVTASLWICVFGLLYAVMPLLNNLKERIALRPEDFVLMLWNACFVTSMLYNTLSARYENVLILIGVGAGLVNFGLMWIFRIRVPSDDKARVCLMYLGLFFINASIGLYFDLGAAGVIFALESLLLALIGLHYKSLWSQAAGGIVFTLSVFFMLIENPFDGGAFRVFANTQFATWAVVWAVSVGWHCAYRFWRAEGLEKISHFLYYIAVLLFRGIIIIEWCRHCILNFGGDFSWSTWIKGFCILSGVMMLLFSVRPMCPSGSKTRMFAGFWAVLGGVSSVVAVGVYSKSGEMIDSNFLIAIAICLAILGVSLHLRLGRENYSAISKYFYVVFLLVLATVVVNKWSNYTGMFETASNTKLFIKGLILLLSSLVVFYCWRPLSGGFSLPVAFGVVVGGAASLIVICCQGLMYDGKFMVIFNSGFMIILVYGASMLCGARLAVLRSGLTKAAAKLAGMVVLSMFVAITVQIFLYWHSKGISNWKFMAHMWVSMSWAVYGLVLLMVGFWRNEKLFRYAAMVIFAMLLAKVFIFDTCNIASVYRIAAFLATGLVLVGVSYMYMHLQKKGFFGEIGKFFDKAGGD